jgi:hypothetical protein
MNKIYFVFQDTLVFPLLLNVCIKCRGASRLVMYSRLHNLNYPIQLYLD